MIVDKTDKALVREFKGGNKGAFDTLCLRHKDRVFNLCYHLLSDYEEAKDVAQDIFVKVYKHLGGFKEESKFSTWLYRVAVNTCKNKIKSPWFRHRFRAVSIGERDCDDNMEVVRDIIDESASPADAVERGERENLVRKAIDTLPKGQKVVILLRHMEGLSYEEIAGITGLNLGTVKSKIARARQGLMKILEKGAI